MRIEYTELCKTITKRINEDIKKYNEALVETAIENRNTRKEAKRALMIDQKQVIALTEDNISTTDRNEVLEITPNYSDLYKAQETKDDEEDITPYTSRES